MLRTFKILFIFAVSFTVNAVAIAQNEICGTVIPDYIVDSVKHRIQSPFTTITSYETTRDNFDTLYFPIQFHIIRRSDHTGGLDTSDIPVVLDILNSAYSTAAILFYSCNDIDYVDDDAYYNYPYNYKTQRTALESQYNYSNAINIYFFPAITNNEGISLAGVSTFPDDIVNNSIAIKNSNATYSTTPHEMGHYFNLYHTHETCFGKEYVTRGVNANCSVAGDLCCDTPADPNLNESGLVNLFCQYIGTLIDPLGEPYAPDPKNFMAYTRQKSCRIHFTEEQYLRIRTAAFHPNRHLMAQHQCFRDTILSGTNNMSGYTIHLNNLQLNNANLNINYCNEVVIESDFMMDNNSTLTITP